MQAAVRLAMLDLRRQIGPDEPIYIAGYSNGAALAVDYTLSVLDGEALPMPAGLVLVSPAIAISRFAALARTRTGLSSVPGFERAAWQVIETEFDPYKYNSFSFNAAGETYRLTTRVTRQRRAAGRRASRFAASRPCWRSSPRSTRPCWPMPSSMRCSSTSRRKATSSCCST